MKYMEIYSINKTNILFNHFTEQLEDQSIEIELYSCKKNKLEKTTRTIQKPLVFLINALHLSFNDYDFTQLTMENFTSIDQQTLYRQLYYHVFIVWKRQKEAWEHINYLKLLLAQHVDVKRCKIYVYSLEEDLPVINYLIYNQQMKRVLIIKTSVK